MPRKPIEEPVVLTAHPPERRRRSTALLATACSCCCCCCFQAVGGIAGAIYGSLKGRPSRAATAPGQEPGEAAEVRAADRHAAAVYGVACVIVLGLSLGVCAIETGASGDWPVGLGAIAFFLPLGQLLASLLALIHLNVFPPARKKSALSRLGRITLWAFLWGLVGSGLTAGLLVFMFH